MELYLNLFLTSLIPAALSLAMYAVQKKTPFGKWNTWVQQILLGLLFGGASICGTEFGVDIGGATANVRDAAPLCAGLLFGAPAGILSGVIGGVERWYAVAWGAGEYTRVACSVSTVLAGLYAAVLRKFMFDDKRPTAGLGAATAVVIEVVHLSLIFVTHLSDASRGYEIVQICTVPMIVMNAFAVAAAIGGISLMSSGLDRGGRRAKSIAQKVQTWMLVSVVAAYFVTTGFVFILQTNMAYVDANNLLKLNVADVKAELTERSDHEMLAVTRKVASEIENGDYDLDALRRSYRVSEINIINDAGIIAESTQPDYVGFNMASGEQSQAFLMLLDGKSEFVQQFGNVSYDEADTALARKYAGCILASGGFVQVGYDATMFQQHFAAQTKDLTQNRHVGSTGYLLIADNTDRIVSESQEHAVWYLTATGVDLSVPPLTRVSGTIYGEAAYYLYDTAENYVIVGVLPVAEAVAARDAMTYTNSFMEVIIFATLFALIYMVIKNLIVRNIRSINRGLEKIIGGDLSVTVDVRASSEFSSLSDDINSTVTTLKHYIDEAAARIDKELEFARSIQLSALPSQFPAFPDVKEVDLYATMHTAKEVGGDFYDFYALPGGRIAFLIADVSGKGVPAAMFMMRAKTLIKNLAEEGLPVNEIFNRANDQLCEGNDAGMFVTAWIGIIDTRTGFVAYANAGHNPPLVYRKDGSFEFLRGRAGLVLAGMPEMRYKAQEFTLAPGDRIFLYTDGVTEATRRDNELYGDARLRQFLNEHTALTVQQMLPAVKENVDAFVGDAEQFDDMTMLMLDYFGGASAMTEKTFPAQVDVIGTVLAFVEGELEKADCPPKTLMQIDVAVEELFVNVAHYAYDGADGNVTIAIGVEDNTATIRLTDSGKPFDPLQRDDPDVTLSAEDRKIGGLGIFMVKKTMDSVAYAYEGGKNVLTITKKLQ